MIDGVYPSQVQEVEQLRHSHYRNLKNIINNHSFSISFPSPRFIEITKTKKANHVPTHLYRKTGRLSFKSVSIFHIYRGRIEELQKEFKSL